MFVQEERWWLTNSAERHDRLNDLSRFGKVISDPNGPAPVVCAVNNLPAWRNSAFSRLPDCHSTEANEKIVRLVAFFPRRVKDRDETGITLSLASNRRWC
jgi:hypothetical protein